METYQVLKNWDSSYEPYIFLLIRLFIQQRRQTTLTINGC